MNVVLANRQLYHPYITSLMLMLLPAKLDSIKGIFEVKHLWLLL